MRTRRGQTLVSFCIALPVAILAWGGGLFLFFLLAAKVALHLDTYFLARAHLYGHDRDHCAPAHFWRELGYGSQLEFKFDCSGAGLVSSEILWRHRRFVQSMANLDHRSEHP